MNRLFFLTAFFWAKEWFNVHRGANNSVDSSDGPVLFVSDPQGEKLKVAVGFVDFVYSTVVP